MTPRLPQPCQRVGHGAARGAAAYDPAIPSDGLTLDTTLGPVDLVAVERAMTGQRTPLTRADATHAITLLPTAYGPRVQDAARGLGVSPAAVKRAVDRRRAQQADRTRP